MVKLMPAGERPAEVGVREIETVVAREIDAPVEQVAVRREGCCRDHALVLGDKEYLFAARAAADKPGQIELVAQACAYP